MLEENQMQLETSAEAKHTQRYKSHKYVGCFSSRFIQYSLGYMQFRGFNS